MHHKLITTPTIYIAPHYRLENLTLSLWIVSNSRIYRIILSMGSANERRRYKVTSSVIGCADTKKIPDMIYIYAKVAGV